MEKDIKKPQIRFQGFTEEWEQRKVQQLIDEQIIEEPMDGNHGEKHPKASDYVERGIPFLMASDIKNGMVDLIHCNFISEKIAERLDKGFAKEGDILLTHKATIGETAILKGLKTKYAILTPQVTYYRILNKKRLNERYLYACFISPTFQNEIKIEAIQSTRAYIGIQEQHKLSIWIPNSLKEQEKIGEFFKQLDNLISLHQRKYDSLVKVKKSMLEKMFPRRGSKKPEIRFAGFTDDWEQRKLGDVATFINGRAYSQEELLDEGKYKVLRVGNFYTNDSWYYSNLELGDKYYANDGDLLYTWSATFGPHIWHGDKVIYHYHIWKIELSDKLEKQFAVQLLEKDKESILSNKNGSTMVHITKVGMEDKNVIIPPNTEEQEKIGDFFGKLDNLISLHQRKLNLLKNIKKAMLEKMFV